MLYIAETRRLLTNFCNTHGMHRFHRNNRIERLRSRTHVVTFFSQLRRFLARTRPRRLHSLNELRDIVFDARHDHRQPTVVVMPAEQEVTVLRGMLQRALAQNTALQTRIQALEQAPRAPIPFLSGAVQRVVSLLDYLRAPPATGPWIEEEDDTYPMPRTTGETPLVEEVD